jgi:hypothetical protein
VIVEDDRFVRTDASFSLGRATAIGVALTPVAGLIVVGTYCLIWGFHSLLAAASLFRHLQLLLPVLVVSIFVHEGLHWFGYVAFGGLAWSSVHFGFSMRAVAAYVHADGPVTVSAYRRLVALPGFVLGIIPACVGIGFGMGSMTLYGFLMLVGAMGDLAILWSIRRVVPGAFVIDHPTRAGCWVLEERGDGGIESEELGKEHEA